MTIRYGVTTGHVEDVKDPQGQGRVKVRFDRIAPDGQPVEGYWAPVATLMAGTERGSWFMPEKDDEVLIAFDHGDVNHPYILGYLWNGKEKPPTDDGIDANTRRIETVSGHILEFYDKQGQERIHIVTQGGHDVLLDDRSGQRKVKIKTTGGNEVHLNDDPTAEILVTTNGKNSVKITDSPAAVDIEVSNGTLTINCTTANVTASGDATVKAGGSATVQAGGSAKIEAGGSLDITAGGSLSITAGGSFSITASTLSVTAGSVSYTAGMTSFSGVVQATTLIATAVVGSAYTPAPGDTLGL